MAQTRLAMHKIKDILRLHLLGGLTSCRRIGRAVGCGKTAVAECLQRDAAAVLTSWETVLALRGAVPPLRAQALGRDASASSAGREDASTSAMVWR